MKRSLPLLVPLLGIVACAHTEPTEAESSRPKPRVGTSVLAPFDPDLPHPNSREQLAQALKDRGFLDSNAKEVQLGASIRQFQRSQGLAETGFPDDETLRRLRIDPRTIDQSLDTAEVQQGGATGIGAH
jgi:putative peptidoglycan binding protein